MRQIVFRSQARRELDEAGDWYEQERIGLGLEFFAEIERLLYRITSNPEQFPILYRGTRKAVARRFPYCVYFRERSQYIVVVAVFHSARNPAAWKSRVK
jgi:plasmid stabilization system protein ParE